MANRYAVATGNWSATATWDGGTLPTSADDVFANGFTVTINQNVNVLSLRTTSASGIAAGGGFTVSNSGFTVQADIYAGTTICLTSNVGTGGTLTITTQTGVCLGGSSTNAYGVNINTVGTVNLTGNPAGGSGSSSFGIAAGNGILNITGNPTGGSGSGSFGVYNISSAGIVNITGNPIGGSASTAHGVSNAGVSSVINIVGNCTGGTSSGVNGVFNSLSGTIVIVGSAVASAVAPGALNNSNGILRVTNAIGNGFGLGSVGTSNVAAVVSSTNNSLTYVQQLTFGSRGATPVSGPIILTDLTTNTVQFYREGGGTKTLVDPNATAGVLPAVGDVRNGTVYAAGNLTGTCAVPAANSVSLGVPVDNTTGTAYITASDITTALTTSLSAPSAITGISSALSSASAVTLNQQTSSLTTPGSIGERLKLASTVATTAQQLSDALSNE